MTEKARWLSELQWSVNPTIHVITQTKKDIMVHIKFIPESITELVQASHMIHYTEELR